MARTADHTTSGRPEPREVGRQLRHVRRKQGLSRSEVARSAGLTRRELAAYERGRAEVPESDLWCLAGSCGVDVSELLPNRAPVKVSSDLSLLAIGDSIRYLRDPVDDDEMLREYLAMIYELRNLPPGSRIPLRERDLMSLADALGGNPERIEARLIELIGMSHQEAARLRAMILPTASLPAPADTTPHDPNNPYEHLTDDPAHADRGEVVDFFSVPRSNDMFEPPPPPGPVSASSGWGDSFEAPRYVPIEPVAPTPIASTPAPTSPMPTPSAMAMPTPNGMPTTQEAPEPYDPPFTPSSETFLSSAPPFAPVDPFAAPEAAPTEYSSQRESAQSDPAPFEYLRDDAAPAPSVGYLVDQPDAPTWPAPAPSTEAFNLDVPTIDWGDADPLPRRLPLSGQPVAPHLDPPQLNPVDEAPVPQLEQWAEPLEPAPFVAEPSSPPPAAPPPPAPAVAFVAPPVAAAPTAYTIPEPPAPLAPPPAAPPVAPIAWNAGAETPDAESELAAAPPPGPAFDRAGSNWRVGGIFPATATADDGALALRRADARWALADVNAEGDFVLETAVDFTAGAGFGVLFRATVDDHDRVSGYSFDIDPIAGGGGYLVRQWEDNRQHWRPLAQTTVTDPTLLFGRHTLSLSLRADQLTAAVDGETVMSVPALSRCSIELGRQACRGPHIGIQAWATTEVTVDSFRVARY